MSTRKALQEDATVSSLKTSAFLSVTEQDKHPPKGESSFDREGYDFSIRVFPEESSDLHAPSRIKDSRPILW